MSPGRTPRDQGGTGSSPAWDPWAPRSGATAAPSSAPGPAPTPEARSAPAATPWSSASGPSLPPSPPSVELGGRPVADERRPPGASPAPPTSWPAPRVVVPTEAPGRRGPGALAVICAFLLGFGLMGAVFASYALGDRRDDASVSTGSSTSTTTRPSGPAATLDIRKILDIAQPSVVSIQTGSPDSIFGAAGSGVVISADGLVLTNAHVIEGAGGNITVRFNDGTTAAATLVGGSTSDDIALIQADATGLTPAKLGSSANLRVGDDVVAIGNALNLGGDPSVTRGIVSAKDRSISDGNISLDHLIQTDAAINHGNSGGPLIDASGEVVGINTAIIEGAQNLGFSLAIDSVEELLDDLKAGGGDLESDQAVLGVSSVDVDSPDITDEVREQYGITATEGALVIAVDPAGAAGDAGLEEGDVITAIDNGAITGAADLTSAVRTHQRGDVVTITVQRAGERRTFDVTLGP